MFGGVNATQAEAKLRYSKGGANKYLERLNQYIADLIAIKTLKAGFISIEFLHNSYRSVPLAKAFILTDFGHESSILHSQAVHDSEIKSSTIFIEPSQIKCHSNAKVCVAHTFWRQ